MHSGPYRKMKLEKSGMRPMAFQSQNMYYKTLPSNTDHCSFNGSFTKTRQSNYHLFQLQAQKTLSFTGKAENFGPNFRMTRFGDSASRGPSAQKPKRTGNTAYREITTDDDQLIRWGYELNR